MVVYEYGQRYGQQRHRNEHLSSVRVREAKERSVCVGGGPWMETRPEKTHQRPRIQIHVPAACCRAELAL